MTSGGASLYDRLAERGAEALGDWVAKPPLALREPVRPRLTKRDAIVWRLQRSTRASIGVERQQALLSAIDATPAQLRALQGAVLIWIDSVARLVQAAEDRHAGERGAGEAKLAEVRAHIATAVTRGRPPFDGIPTAACAWVSDSVTPWLVDALVFLANRYALWAPLGDATGARRLPAIATAAASAARLVPRAVAFVLSAFGRALAAAGRGLERPGSWLASEGRETAASLVGVSTRPALGPALAGLAWAGRQREHLIPAIELIAASVAVAEAELELSDRERAAYATELVLLVLADIGLDTSGKLAGAVADFVAGLGVVVVRRHLRAGSLVVDDGPRVRRDRRAP